MKGNRQEKILEIIEKYNIGTQEELISRLAECGFSVTQTTISRDIRPLKLVKGLSQDGSYKYIVPSAKRGDAGHQVLNAAISDSVTTVEAAQNIVVVKTLPGMANAVAVCMDSLCHDDIVGSVAGDDTVLLVVKTSEAADALAENLKNTFGKK